jgi:hypothetical protein
VHLLSLPSAPFHPTLKDEIRELEAEILKHAGSDCGAIPDASPIIHHSVVNMKGPKTLQIEDRSQVASQAARTEFRNERQHGSGGEVTSPDATNGEAMRSAASNSTAFLDSHVNADLKCSVVVSNAELSYKQC